MTSTLSSSTPDTATLMARAASMRSLLERNADTTDSLRRGACGIHMKNERGEMSNLGLSLMPMSELRIEDTWFMAGMKGTGSNTIVADNVFVPEHRFLPYPQAFGGVLSHRAQR